MQFDFPLLIISSIIYSDNLSFNLLEAWESKIKKFLFQSFPGKFIFVKLSPSFGKRRVKLSPKCIKNNLSLCDATIFLLFIIFSWIVNQVRVDFWLSIFRLSVFLEIIFKVAVFPTNRHKLKFYYYYLKKKKSCKLNLMRVIFEKIIIRYSIRQGRQTWNMLNNFLDRWHF